MVLVFPRSLLVPLGRGDQEDLCTEDQAMATSERGREKNYIGFNQ